ncbi:hypothetical protein [Undibacterium danionis]|uniref:Uncharacterized protein n=1 Tax=Undibacterium danionis TaxID=1812100 RepID=A0ABV6IJS5_9BURK
MKKISINMVCLRVLLVVGLSDISVAFAQQRSFEANRKQEMRQRRVEEFRAIRQIEHQERLHHLSEKAAQRQPISNESGLPTAARSGSEMEARPLPKFNRLTPEERIALRRQIREAREDIYLKRQEKN